MNVKLSEKDIQYDKLKEYVSEMAYNLKQIINSDTMDYDSEKHVVEMVYETAYNLIKYELMITGKSGLYSYIKQEEINVSYFNILIKNDISKIDFKDKKNNYIKTKMFELRKSGINSSYFDLDLIKGLLIQNGNKFFKDSINKNMIELVSHINDNAKEINKLYYSLCSDIVDRDNYKQNIKKNNKNIRKRLISFLIATSIMVSGGNGVQKLAKNSAISDKYIETTEIYSSITDDVTVETNEFFLSKEPETETIVRVYDPYKNDSERTCHYYDVSYLDFDTPYEYYAYGVDNYGVVANDITLRSSGYDVISDYMDSYTEVTRKTYKYGGVDLDKESYYLYLFLGFFMYLFAFLFLEYIYKKLTNPKYDYIVIGGISELYEETADLLRNKEAFNKYKGNADKNINKMMELINQSDELRNEFNRLYEANRYLLNNPDELYNKVIEAINKNIVEESKKLVKENKNKR